MKSNPARLLSPLRYALYNHLTRRVQRTGRGRLLPYRGSVLIVDRDARIVLSEPLRLGANCFVPNGRTSLLRLDAASTLVVNGAFSMYYGCDVIVFAGGRLTLGRGFLNSDTKIRCKSEIAIGDGCAIAHNVTIQDYDGHTLFPAARDDREARAIALPIRIGDHVWIGCKATILKGVAIGDGAVIASGAVVTRDVPPRCLAAGVPARILRENVEWE